MSKESEVKLDELNCLYSLLDRANHNEYLSRIGKKEALEFLNQNQKYAIILRQSLQRLDFIDNSKPSEALEDLEQLAEMADKCWVSCDVHKWKNTIKNYILKAQEQEKENKALAFDYLVKHFNFEFKAESIRNGEKWARFVTIQSKDDEGTWDTTAMANLVDYKEEYEFLEQMLKPKN